MVFDMHSWLTGDNEKCLRSLQRGTLPGDDGRRLSGSALSLGCCLGQKCLEGRVKWHGCFSFSSECICHSTDLHRRIVSLHSISKQRRLEQHHLALSLVPSS